MRAHGHVWQARSTIMCLNHRSTASCKCWCSLDIRVVEVMLFAVIVICQAIAALLCGFGTQVVGRSSRGRCYRPALAHTLQLLLPYALTLLLVLQHLLLCTLRSQKLCKRLGVILCHAMQML